jgi:hypothetical protein
MTDVARPAIPFIVATAAILLFTTMDAIVKAIPNRVPTIELVAMRFIFGIPLVLLVKWRTGGGVADAFVMESQRAPRCVERCVHAAVLHSAAPAAIRRGTDAGLPRVGEYRLEITHEPITRYCALNQHAAPINRVSLAAYQIEFGKAIQRAGNVKWPAKKMRRSLKVAMVRGSILVAAALLALSVAHAADLGGVSPSRGRGAVVG